MGVEQITEIINGLSSSETIFYSIGGSVLVVLAGMWGFNRVKGLLGAESLEDNDNDDWVPSDDDYSDYILDKMGQGGELTDEEADFLFANSEEVR